MESNIFPLIDIVITLFRMIRFLLTYIVPFVVIVINVILLFAKKKKVEVIMDMVMAGVSIIVLDGILQTMCTSCIILADEYIMFFALITICIIAVEKIKSKSLKMFLIILKIVIYSICSLFLISQIIVCNVNTYLAVFIMINYVLCSIRYVLNMRLVHKENK